MAAHATTITLASYNMHKAVGLDGRRDPHRVLRVLQEIDADVVALQEADKRVGGRGSTVPHELIDSHGMYKPVHLGVRHKRVFDKARRHTDRLLKVNTRNIGWHGNAILVKRHVGVIDCAALELPTLEPRGAVIAELLINEKPLRVVGMHLDLS
ncbi:MAG TPA: endonuclease/exonuclease/phosphatase family protein, partial [Sphingomicrobium sp.]